MQPRPCSPHPPSKHSVTLSCQVQPSPLLNGKGPPIRGPPGASCQPDRHLGNQRGVLSSKDSLKAAAGLSPDWWARSPTRALEGASRMPLMVRSKICSCVGPSGVRLSPGNLAVRNIEPRDRAPLPIGSWCTPWLVGALANAAVQCCYTETTQRASPHAI